MTKPTISKIDLIGSNREKKIAVPMKVCVKETITDFYLNPKLMKIS